jgi:hypothetical protein
MSSATDTNTHSFINLKKDDDVNLEPKEFLPFEPQIVEADPAEDKPEGSDAA